MARRKGSTPVPASSGSPSPLTSPPNRPVCRAWSKFDTAARNCGLVMICSSTSVDGGTGRSEGKCGNSAGTNSGWLANSGLKVSAFRTSLRETASEKKNKHCGCE